MKQDSAAPHNRATGLNVAQMWQIFGTLPGLAK
jgi:hypothetical protein